MNETIPLLRHALSSPSAFTPEALVSAVRTERKLLTTNVPQVCVLDFDGDLTDWLLAKNFAVPHPSWACFHTAMSTIEVNDAHCGIIARTIGGPYAVLIAEQLFVSGARVVLGLTSAGRVLESLPVPSLVLSESAIRDEGTSYHYLPLGGSNRSVKYQRISCCRTPRCGIAVTLRTCLDHRCAISGNSRAVKAARPPGSTRSGNASSVPFRICSCTERGRWDSCSCNKCH